MIITCCDLKATVQIKYDQCRFHHLFESNFNKIKLQINMSFQTEESGRLGNCSQKQENLINASLTDVIDQLAQEIRGNQNPQKVDGRENQEMEIKRQLSQNDQHQVETSILIQSASQLQNNQAEIDKQQQHTNNLLNKGKTKQDNILIRSTLHSAELIQLPIIHLIGQVSYQGQWKQAKREGFGTNLWKDGSKYIGNWKQDQAEGKGILYHADGDIYDGDWIKNKANGFGTYVHSKVPNMLDIGRMIDRKVTEWKSGLMARDIKEITQMAKKQEKENYHFSDGSYYEGDFLWNQIHGYGKYVWFNNKTYEGDWAHNKMHGYGRSVWADGRIYQGQYYNDKKHGVGTFSWSDGKKYIGNFQNGVDCFYWRMGNREEGSGMRVNVLGGLMKLPQIFHHRLLDYQIGLILSII